MARSFGRVLCSIWADSDFVARTPNAQRMYLFLLSQPKLSMVGVIDYMPSRWAKAAAGLTEVDVETALDELEQHRFVIVDENSDEILIRSLVRHDGVTRSWQLLKAMWSSWKAVASPKLRLTILRELPDEAWNNPKAPVPSDVERPSNPDFDETSDPASDAASNGSLNPDFDTPCDAPCDTPSDGTWHLPKPSDEAFHRRRGPSDAPSDDDGPVTIQAVLEVLAQRDLAAAAANVDPTKRPKREQPWLAKARQTLKARHGAALDDLLATNHGMTAEEIADELEPSSPPPKPPPTECDLYPKCTWTIDDDRPHDQVHSERMADEAPPPPALTIVDGASKAKRAHALKSKAGS